MHILLVDDHQVNLYMLDVLLRGHGFTVTMASDGIAALEQLVHGGIDLIISDILMPRMDGFQFCHTIKTDPHWRHIPLIFYTATYTDPEDEAFAMRLGAARFVAKPAEPEVLLAVVQEVLQEYQASPHPISSEAVTEETAYLHAYNARLVHKLEDKLQELEGANASLRASEERYRSLIENSIQGIVLHRAFVICMANQAAAQIFGYASPAELIGTDVRQVFAVHERSRFAAEVVTPKGETSEALRFEIQATRQDGTPLWCECVPSWVPWAGEVACLLTLLDITERKHLEEQLRQGQKLEALGTLVGGIAHDFNSILMAIMGHAELLREKMSQDNPVWYHVQDILTAASRGRNLVRQILTFSRKTPVERRVIRLAPLIEEALQLVRTSLPTTVVLQSHMETMSDTVYADATQLHQVLLNLCSNAGHAMQSTGGILEVRLEELEITPLGSSLPAGLAPGAYVRLSVQDTGHGMTPEIVARIFEPFFTTKELHKGTGMGLAVVHGIVSEHGGTITVESTPGHGTLFAVYLPRVPEAPLEDAQPYASPPKGVERIAFVDDEEDLIYLAQEVLTRLGYEPVVFTSSPAALEAFRADPYRFDLVITDQNMPTMPGDVLVRELRRIRADIPIILCTGFGYYIEPSRAQALGLNGILTKPWTIQDLALAIRRCLD